MKKIFKRVCALLTAGVFVVSASATAFAGNGEVGVKEFEKRVLETLVAVSDYFENMIITMEEPGKQVHMVPVGYDHYVRVTIGLTQESVGHYGTDFLEDELVLNDVDFAPFWTTTLTSGSTIHRHAHPGTWSFSLAMDRIDPLLGGSFSYQLRVAVAGTGQAMSVSYLSSTVNVTPPLAYGYGGSSSHFHRRVSASHIIARGFFTFNALGAWFIPVTYNINVEVLVGGPDSSLSFAWRVGPFE